MAKALRTVAMVAGAVALVASGVGALGGTALAAGSLGGAAAASAAGGTILGVSAATVGTIATLTAGVASLGASVLAKTPSFSREGNPQDFATNPQSGLPYCIGRTRMSGLRIHADTYDSPAFRSESKDDVLAFAVLLSAGGACEQIETFRADKEAVTFDGGGGAIGNFGGYMAQATSLGLAGASALALSFGGVAFPGWTAAHKLSGIAHALWNLRYDPKGERYGAGVPEPEWIGKWVRVYDPRKDSTYPGGSGAHRALDETTYEWSRNPYLHALTWALGRWQNGNPTLGIGAPIGNIRVADFVEGANVADANEWYCGGVEWSTDSKWSTLKRMLQAGGGEPTMTGAMIGCRVDTPRISVATVTADKLLDSLSIATTRSRRDRFNSVIPRYRSELHDWEVISGAPVTVDAYVEEDGGLRTREIDFPLVQAEHVPEVDGDRQAGQLAAYAIVNSREGGPIRFTVGPEYIGVTTGDVVTLDAPGEGLDAQPVLIRARSVDPATFKITFEAETETEAKHAFALGKVAVPPPTYAPSPPDLTPPAPGAALWDVTPGYAGMGSPAITVAGLCEFPGADAVLIEYREAGEADWSSLGKLEASAPIRRVVSPLASNGEYYVRIAYRSGNRIGPWLELDPVPTPWTITLDPSLSPAVAYVPANEDGSVGDYTAAAGTFAIRTFEGAELTPYFTLSTAPGGNPDGLVVSYDDQSFAVTGGIAATHAEDTTRLTIRATGTGFYTNLVVDRTLTIIKDYSVVLTDVAGNFNARNDRNGDAIPACVIAGDGTAIDHRANDDGSVDISFEWTFPGDVETIDRYEVEFHSSTSSSPHASGTTPAFRIQIEPDVPAIILQGVSATLCYTPAVRAVRVVDPDVAPGRRIHGAWAKSTATGENPYRPQSQPFFLGTIGESVGGVAATVVAATIDPATGEITAGRVVTSSIGANAVTQTLSVVNAPPLNVGIGGIWPDMRCITKVNCSPEDGEDVRLLAEIVASVSFFIAAQPAGTEFAAWFAITRGPQSLAINLAGVGATSYLDYLDAGGEVIVAPYAGKVFTYNDGIGSGDYRSEDAPVILRHVDEDVAAGDWTYGFWMSDDGVNSVANTRHRQGCDATRLKR